MKWLFFFIISIICYIYSTAVPTHRPSIESYLGRFWHVTDFHWDLNYTEFGDENRMCWNTKKGGRPGESVGHFGNYACDSPWTLVESTLHFMNTYPEEPDFIVWTGDDSAHVLDKYFNLEKVLHIIGNVSNAIQNAFPNKPIFPVFGNHDAFPKHSFPDGKSVLYERVADLWKDWLKEGKDTFVKGGYYTLPHPTVRNVRILGLNTPIYYQKNPLIMSNDVDPAGQFAWLESTLANMEADNLKAYIIGHVPPGIFGRKIKPTGYTWMRPAYNKQYLEIITRYARIIVGHLYGHDHTDSFKIYYDEIGSPVNVHFTAPAVTPWNTTLAGIGPNNPGVRLFTYDTIHGNIKDYTQFYLNLTQANLVGQDQWRQEYSFKDAYDLNDLTPLSIDRVTQTFVTNNRTYFDKYFLYNSVSVSGPEDCDSVCKQNHYCSITRVDYQQFVACNGASSYRGKSTSVIVDNDKHVLAAIGALLLNILQKTNFSLFN